MKENTIFNEISSLVCVLVFVFMASGILNVSGKEDIFENLDKSENNNSKISFHWPDSVDSLKNSEPFKSIPYIRGGSDDTDVYVSRPKLIGGRICISTWGAFFSKGKIVKEKFIEDTCARDSFIYTFNKKRLGSYPYCCVRYSFYDNNDTLLCTKQIISH